MINPYCEAYKADFGVAEVKPVQLIQHLEHAAASARACLWNPFPTP